MISQTATKLRHQISKFSGKLSHGLGKVRSRLVEEMLYGIQARQSVHLTEAARSLEEPIALIKTEERLSRNLAHEEIKDVLQPNLTDMASSRIKEDTLLVLDLSDIVKPYAEKMENLARVRDGSRDEIANGYWTAHVIGVENESHDITPLYGELYSQDAEDFISENHEILKAVRHVSDSCKNRGVWVVDRGGDRRELYKELVPRDNNHSFIIRQKGDRHLLFGKQKMSTLSIALGCSLPYSECIVKEEKGKEKVYHIEYGFRPVRLPEHPDVQLYLVVVTGFGGKPMMLLTDRPMRRKRDVIWWVVSAYITRWRIEETIRYMKQCYNVEDVRVLKYARLRNIVVLVTCVMYFACVVLGDGVKLEILASHVYKAAKRLFGAPDFRFYAIADGIKEIFSRSPRKAPKQNQSTAPPPLIEIWEM